MKRWREKSAAHGEAVKRFGFWLTTLVLPIPPMFSASVGYLRWLCGEGKAACKGRFRA